MRILVVFSILILSTVSGFGQEELICENLNSFYALWKDAAFGKDPNRTEKAAWVILSPEGSYELQRWPASGARNSETWKGEIPDRVVAIVHTHSVIMDEKPS